MVYSHSHVDHFGGVRGVIDEADVKAGRVQVIAPAGFTHTHRGNVPTSGDKYIATSWILYQRAEALFGQPG